MRGATRPSGTALPKTMNFNPRSSCEEQRDSLDAVIAKLKISIHAPHARSDKAEDDGVLEQRNFNPRSSCEERRNTSRPSATSSNFNPRSSCEERHWTNGASCGSQSAFQSTLLMRGATSSVRTRPSSALLFQSTLLMRGATLMAYRSNRLTKFQSTLLMRRATSYPHVSI